VGRKPAALNDAFLCLSIVMASSLTGAIKPLLAFYDVSDTFCSILTYSLITKQINKPLLFATDSVDTVTGDGGFILPMQRYYRRLCLLFNVT
jgi:hypothetical protein